MTFNSVQFVFQFLPAVLAGYYLIGRKSVRMAKLFLLGMSVIFYAGDGTLSLLLFMLIILVNCAAMQGMKRLAGSGRKTAQAAGIVFDIAVLAAFKYVIPQKSPMGVSFFIFALIALLAEYGRGDLQEVSIEDTFLYAMFFPKISQGPIASPEMLIPQLQKPDVRPDYDRFVSGIRLFTAGLAKKVLIADHFSEAVFIGMSNYRNEQFFDVLVTMLAYTMQIYFDFSGYCDMASGAARMLGFSLPVNFDSPYKSVSVTEFWKRWHISLTDFFRKYVYFPLGGSRRGTARTYLNILIVFAVSGIWHGNGFTFLIWGLMHAVMQILERIFGKALDKIPRVIRWAGTFLFVNLAWLMFRAESPGQWVYMAGQLLEPSLNINTELFESLRIPGLRAALGLLHIPYTDLSIFLLSAFLLLFGALLLCLIPKNAQRRPERTDRLSLVWTAALFLVSVVLLGRVSTFIYADF